MLLRTAGYTLSNDLLSLMSVSRLCKVEEDIAIEAIAGIMTSWIGIMLLTKAGKENSDVIKLSEADLMSCIPGYDDSTCFGRAAHCVLKYLQDRNQKSENTHPSRQDMQYSSLFEVSQRSHIPQIPNMYMRSGTFANDYDDDDESNQATRQESTWEDTPLIPGRLDQSFCEVWDSCWENLACDSDEGKRLALFRPLLLYIACTAKNMVQINSFYLCDIGLIDL